MTAPLRVGMVLTTMGYGGVPEVVLQLMQHLPRDRYAPFLCVLKREADDAAVCDERRDRCTGLGFDVHYAAASSRKLDTVAAVADWISDRGLHVLHTHSNRPNVFGRMAGILFRPRGLRVVAHYHNQYDDKWDKEPVMLALERRLWPSTDAMIAVSESVRAHVADRVGVDAARIAVVPNGVDAARFAAGAAAGAAAGDLTGAVAGEVERGRRKLGVDGPGPVLGLVGRVTEQKGQEDFVEAALLLLLRRPDAHCLMVGHAEDPALQRRLERRIAEAGQQQRVRFVGNRDDMAAVYRALDVVVAPSRWEGFGMMLVEAMAAGRPIVAARAGAIPEVVRDGETAVLVPPRDPVALAAALGELLADPARQRRLGDAGLGSWQRFAWPVAAAAVAAIYDRVLREQLATG